MTVLLTTCARANESGFVPLHGSMTFRPGGAFPTTVGTTRGPAYASWSGSDANTGTLHSDPFPAPLAIALDVAGYPSHRGMRLALERLDQPQSYRLSPGDPGEEWRTYRIEVPISWYGKPIELIARDESTGYAGWEGVAGLSPLSLLESLVAADRMASIAALFVLFIVWLGPGIVLASMLSERYSLDVRATVPVALVASSIFALSTFFLSLASPLLGRVFAWTIIALAAVAVASPARRALIHRCTEPDVSWPLALILSGSLLCTALLDASAKSFPLTQSTQTVLTTDQSLPPDDILPGLLADHVAQHLPARPFLGDWLSSDRPPLQAGIDLFARTVYPHGSFEAPRYEAASTLAQCCALAMVFGLARCARASIRRALFVTAMIGCSGFFVVNALYVWPKLLAAALAGSGIIFYHVVSPSRTRYAAAGAAFGLGMMAHGGVAFTLPVLAAVALCRERRRAVGPLFIGLGTMVMIMLPWSAYAHFIDPPGDRLLKWHLAGHMEVDATPLPRALINAYTQVPFSTIVANKVSNVALLLGADEFPPESREFFKTLPALNWLPLGLLGLLLALPQARWRIMREADIGYIAIAVAALALWCALMYGPGTTVIHQGSYLTMLLLMTGLALAASRTVPLALLVAGLELWRFASLHLAPHIVIADVPASVLTACIAAAAVLAGAAVPRASIGIRSIRGLTLAAPGVAATSRAD